MALEDFTTWDQEVDPNSHIGVAANKLDVDGITKNEDAWHGDDKGLDHFGNTFEHHFDYICSACDDTDQAGSWAVSQTVDDCADWVSNDEYAVLCHSYWHSILGFRLRLRETKNNTYDTWAGSNFATQYQFEVERSGANGVTVSARIYNDGKGTLHDTLVVTIPANDIGFRYVFGAVSRNDGVASGTSFDFENLDLNEGAAFVPYPFSRGLRGGVNALTGGLA